jgi:hypothetical protein
VNLFKPDIAVDPIAQELVRAWTAALRSDRFRQASGRLRTGHGWCVLGVACHAYDAGGWRCSGGTWSYLDCNEELPAEVADAFRLRTACGRYGPDPEARSLATDNDEGRTFAELADLIDRQMAAAITRLRRRRTNSRLLAGAGGAAR